MVAPGEDPQNISHGAQAFFNRLVRVRIRPNGDGPYLIGLCRQLPRQHLARARLNEKLRLKIKPRGEAHIGVGGPGKAVDAAMFTPPVRIDGSIKTDIEAVIIGDDPPRPLKVGSGFNVLRRRVRPPIIDPFCGCGLVPSRLVRPRAASPPRAWTRAAEGRGRGAGHDDVMTLKLEQIKNKMIRCGE